MYAIRYIRRGESTERNLYIPGSEIYYITEGKLHLGIGISGDLEITIPSYNPAVDDLRILTDEIVFYRNNIELWRGRPISSEQSFDLQTKIVCEGCLSYFYDTFYPPYTHKGTISDFFTSIIQNHNLSVEAQKRFNVGYVTVTDSNNYISRSCKSYSRSLSVLKDKLQDSTLGGYLRVRVENGVKYLDYLSGYNTTATQPAKYGYNILDAAINIEYNDLITAVLPLGAQQEETGIMIEDSEGEENDSTTGTRLTIKSINNNSPYIYDADAVSKYGWICDVAEWDDVTLPENLMERGQAYLQEHMSAIKSFTIKAVDMNLADNTVISWQIGDKVQIKSSPHGIDINAELTELEIDIINIENNILTFGSKTSLTDSINRNQSSVEDLINSEIQNRRNAYSELQKAINESNGFFVTAVQQGNGSSVYYMHDAKELANSTFVTKVTSEAIGLSTDGGKTYPFGFTVTGAMVMDIIQANGIDAQYINVKNQGTQKNLSDTIAELSVGYGQISQKVSQTDYTGATIVSKINQTASTVTISAQHIKLEGIVTANSNFKVLTDGSIECKNATISGTVTAGFGSLIGGWSINDDKIYAGNSNTGVAVMQKPTSRTTYVFAAGGSSHSSYVDCPFRVTSDGLLYAAEAKFSVGNGDGISLFTDTRNDNIGILRSNTNGEAYLGTTNYRWHSVYCSDGAFNGSDRKIKNHIDFMNNSQNVEDFIYSLQPVFYTLKAGEGKRTHMGFYAQDVADSAKKTIGDLAVYQASVISKNDKNEIIEGYYSENEPDENLTWVLNYSEFIAPLVATIQKQHNEIAALNDRLYKLESQIWE